MNIVDFAVTGGRNRTGATALIRLAVACFLVVQLAAAPFASAANGNANSVPVATTSSDPVLNAMQAELSRATSELGKQEQPPYYLSYTVYD